MTHKTMGELKQEFSQNFPDKCPRCGWHKGSHGNSRGLYSDCPYGLSQLAEERRLPNQLYDAQMRLRATAQIYDQGDIIELGNLQNGECYVLFNNGSVALSGRDDHSDSPKLRKLEDSVVMTNPFLLKSDSMVLHVKLYFMDDGAVRWKL